MKIETHKLKLRTVLNVFLITLLLSSICSLYLNQGLRLTTYSSSYVIEFRGAQASQAFEQSRNSVTANKVDYTSNRFYFQNTNTTDVAQKLTTLREQHQDAQNNDLEIVSYLQQPVSPLSSPINLTGILAWSMVTAGFLYLAVWSKMNKADRSVIILSLIGGLLLSTISSLGLLSLISIFVMIGPDHIYMVMFGIILAILVLFHAVYRYVAESQVSRKDNALDRISNLYQTDFQNLTPLFLVAVVVLMVAAGTAAILDLLILAAVLLIMALGVVRWTDITYNLLNFDWQKIAVNFNRSKNKKKRK